MASPPPVRPPEDAWPADLVFGSGEKREAAIRLWSMTIEATFEASSVENAELIVKRLTEDVLDHVAVWSATGEFNPEQTTEAVDV